MKTKNLQNEINQVHENIPTQTTATTKKKRSPYLHKYLLKNCLINYGVINGVINAVIFYFLHFSQPNATFHAPELMMDFALTSFILSAILAFCVFGMNKKKAQKGEVPCLPYSKNEHLILKWFPKNIVGVAALTAIIVTLLVPTFFVGAMSGLGLLPMSLLSATILKGFMCMVAGMGTGYFCLLSMLFRYSKPNCCII